MVARLENGDVHGLSASAANWSGMGGRGWGGGGGTGAALFDDNFRFVVVGAAVLMMLGTKV